jgi:predicted methyltransferase
VLAEVVAGDWRGDDAKARDKYRHPVESLTFWGLKPGMAILEIQPGGASWWTEILAPYAKRTGGTFYVTGADLDNPELSEGARKSRADFEARYGAKPDLYGKIGVVNWGAKSKPLPSETFDLILTARSIHGWMQGEPGMPCRNVQAEFHKALKPGGILAVEQHRAKPGPTTREPRFGLRHRGLRDRAGAEGRLHARSQIRDQRESEGHRTTRSASGRCRRIFVRRLTAPARTRTRRTTRASTSRSASRTG